MLRTCGSSMETVTQMMLMVWFLKLHTHMFFLPFQAHGEGGGASCMQCITAPVETVPESMCCSFVE